MAYRDNPPTDCVRCQQAEMTGWERTVAFVRDVWQGRQTSAAVRIAAYGRMLSVALGTGQGLDPRYEQHRAMFMQTGDGIWLARMLRHLEPRD